MKNVLWVLVLSLLLSCTEDEPQAEPDSPLLETVWHAPDEIRDLIYGGENYQVLEFLSNTEVQYYAMQNGTVDDQESGTYVFEAPNLTITFDDAVRNYEVTGSLMVSERPLSTGGFLTYTKQ